MSDVYVNSSKLDINDIIVTHNNQIYAFPEKCDDFTFNTNHVTDNVMYKIFSFRTAYRAFNTFIKVIFVQKQNRFIKKTKINSNISYVHIGNDKWIKKQDVEAISTFIQCVVNEALRIIASMEKRGVLCEDRETIRNFLTYVNSIAQNDKDKYENTFEDIKELLVEIHMHGILL